ncbi:hypothetical protein CAPTEDRAFT_200595 [Capitella teleta]|uniref:MULE transposase domain-containing protein n=1 Tax=Capitella teleta TaxID=283909 RepID=R7T896_CAPTE|nr:hypothetical protein CAPTEDRAFT_200595 [Capitella teleta]|eukprot:ELT89899.1 hypothetical protein CAPTEDRAFT_200595 [Capitella teleta]
MVQDITVMLDKDESEIAAIKQQMPRATILLCTFHVIKNFKTKINELVIPADQKTELSSGQSTPPIYEYFFNNWLEDKGMWAHHKRRHLLTLSNNTNNRIESENAKLKRIMDTT